ATIQSILFLGHFFLYETWAFSPGLTSSHGSLELKTATGILSVSFVTASLLAFRYTNAFVRAFYRAAAVWLGLLSFLFIGAIGSWMVLGPEHRSGVNLNVRQAVEALFAFSARIGLPGGFTAGCPRATPASGRL